MFAEVRRFEEIMREAQQQGQQKQQQQQQSQQQQQQGSPIDGLLNPAKGDSVGDLEYDPC